MHKNAQIYGEWLNTRQQLLAFWQNLQSQNVKLLYTLCLEETTGNDRLSSTTL
jgi:hypothetical protein